MGSTNGGRVVASEEKSCEIVSGFDGEGVEHKSYQSKGVEVSAGRGPKLLEEVAESNNHVGSQQAANIELLGSDGHVSFIPGLGPIDVEPKSVDGAAAANVVLGPNKGKKRRGSSVSPMEIDGGGMLKRSCDCEEEIAIPAVASVAAREDEVEAGAEEGEGRG
ncbi:hypothetical protein COLO4_13212 [Corchorus olitorius]|uniref:Uncharacterized protein n=1 Tax=Corchorus olitorius TaxID=93759 RepID=A0A1R3JXH2_9ROSI|nr:hypothetical protein COLO4_13212 [Corchorus olitorius]